MFASEAPLVDGGSILMIKLSTLAGRMGVFASWRRALLRVGSGVVFRALAIRMILSGNSAEIDMVKCIWTGCQGENGSKLNFGDPGIHPTSSIWTEGATRTRQSASAAH